MPTSALLPAALRRGATKLILPGILITGLAVSGCTVLSGGGNQPTPTATDSGTASPNNPSGSPSGSPASPSVPPSVSGSPTGSPSPGGSGTPLGSAAPVSCTSVTPIRVEKVTSEPRRTIETVTLVSDGRALKPGTREETDFLTPTLSAPDGSTNTDEATLTKIGTLIASSSRNRVLLTRPDPPDTRANPSRPPYNTPGTYVAYSASATLNADVIVDCSGTEQRWLFRSEADLTLGVVNCAVEPPNSNAVARSVYANNC